MEIGGKTAVITGASSGIGRAAANAFAREGCNVVVAARRKHVLDEVARECVQHGVEASAVETDVTDWGAVQRLAATTLDRAGGLHIWINNAGVGLFGAFPDGGLEAHRRVVETNLIGTLHGCAAALPIMRREHEGVVINVSSIGGLMAVPYAATYAASKAGILAFAASLREELRDQPGIAVCTALPSFVDTPALEHHGANMSGRKLDPSGPTLDPGMVAQKLVGLAKSPKAELDIGWATTGARLGGKVSSWLNARVAGLAVRRYLSKAEPAADTEGNLFRSVPEGKSERGSRPEHH